MPVMLTERPPSRSEATFASSPSSTASRSSFVASMRRGARPDSVAKVRQRFLRTQSVSPYAERDFVFGSVFFALFSRCSPGAAASPPPPRPASPRCLSRGSAVLHASRAVAARLCPAWCCGRPPPPRPRSSPDPALPCAQTPTVDCCTHRALARGARSPSTRDRSRR